MTPSIKISPSTAINSLPLPPLPPSRVGVVTKTTNIDGTSFRYRVEDQEIFVAPSNVKKAFILQKLSVDQGQGFEHGLIMYRIGYYMIGHKPRMKGKWAWGQFAAMMTAEELKLIVEKMEVRGWI
jgi:hypothetical protein